MDEKTGCVQSSVHIWEVATGKEITKITQMGKMSAKFNRNGKYILSSGSDNTVRVWDVFSRKEIFHVSVDEVEIVSGVVFSPDEKYVAGGWINMHVWESETGREILKLPFSSGIGFVTFSPDGKFLAFEGDASYATHVVQIWEVATGKEVFRKLFDSNISSVAFSSDGKYLLVSGDAIEIWELFPGQHGIPPMTLPSGSFSPDGRHVILRDGLFIIISDFFTGEEVFRTRLTGSKIDVQNISFSADGFGA